MNRSRSLAGEAQRSLNGPPRGRAAAQLIGEAQRSRIAASHSRAAAASVSTRPLNAGSLNTTNCMGVPAMTDAVRSDVSRSAISPKI